MSYEECQYLVSFLEEYKGALQTLIKLNELNGETYLSDLVSRLDINDKTLRNVRGRLLSIKLITLDQRLDPKDKKYRLFWVLTDKGKIVAELAAEIEEELRKED